MSRQKEKCSATQKPLSQIAENGISYRTRRKFRTHITMSALKIIGIVLIVIGIAMLATGSFHYKEKKKILDTDVVDINRTETKIVTWPRIAGAVVIVGGIVLILLERGRRGDR